MISAIGIAVANTRTESPKARVAMKVTEAKRRVASPNRFSSSAYAVCKMVVAMFIMDSCVDYARMITPSAALATKRSIVFAIEALHLYFRLMYSISNGCSISIYASVTRLLSQ